MIPRRVELENFLSFGDRQVFDFTAGDEPLWVLCGANGVGKSAVFDAMTFALFNQHRGGGQNADELVRHGANGFRVVYEFEFAGARYEVERSRAGKRSVNRARRWAGDRWEDADLTAHAGRDKITGWAVATLGLGYEAFTSSVMLRQGEADRIITARPGERLDFLRQVIGADRYERLHDRVQAAARHLKARLDAAEAERDRLPEVTPAELEQAAAALEAAAADLAAARADDVAAVVRIEQARQWAKLEAERAEVDRLLRAADERAAAGERIRADHARFRELEAALPVARDLVGLRDRLKQLDADLARLTAEAAAAAADRDEAAAAADEARKRVAESAARAEADRREAARLRETAARGRKLLALAEEVAALEAQAGGFPAELDKQRDAAEAEVGRLAEARTAAAERRATAAGHLQSAEKRRREFGAVEVGTKCLRCGQEVSPEHAEKERAALDAEVAQHRRERDAAKADEETAAGALATATAGRDRLTATVRERDRLRDHLALQRRNLSAHAADADPAALRTGVEAQEQDAARLETAAEAAAGGQQKEEIAAKRHDADRKRHADRAADLDAELQTAKTAHTRDAATREARLDQLPANWRDRLPTLTAGDLDREQVEFEQLRDANVIGRFDQLTRDTAERAGWEQRRATVAADLEAIPAAARCPAADAEQAARAAAARLAAADTAHTSARDRDTGLRAAAARRRELTDQHRDLDRRHRLHAALAELLGPKRLQRQLVRAAERAIVRYANGTLHNLSRGDLTVELDAAGDITGKALDLRVRRADDPTPIGVSFLSGSQKFRVAVAVALAIGRFASGHQARPLEGVIIDEGFGSLDRDGLAAMGDELRNLQQAQELKRLILVSHQEEFTARFPVGYHLMAGDGGTTAAPFNREGGGPGDA